MRIVSPSIALGDRFRAIEALNRLWMSKNKSTARNKCYAVSCGPRSHMSSNCCLGQQKTNSFRKIFIYYSGTLRCFGLYRSNLTSKHDLCVFLHVRRQMQEHTSAVSN